jgi:hypothetical protein
VKSWRSLGVVLILIMLMTPDQDRLIVGAALPPPTDISSPDTTYWVSPGGQAAWTNCRGAMPLDGVSACALSTANTNAVAGDTIYLRGGTYSNQEIRPSNSGTSDSNRIVYTSYDQENVTIRDSAYGIYIYKKSYITVSGVNFYSLRRFFRIYAGHYNTISYCDFDTRSPASGDWAGAIIADDFNDSTPASENSTYNWVHHCTFYRWVYGAYDGHRGGVLDIGSWVENPVDESYYNLIEDNTFAYGGHHTLGVYSKYNVIRNNYFHNETNPAEWAFEGYRDSITEGPVGGHNLYEGNRFGISGASGLGLRTPYNLLRFNLFYYSSSGGLQVVSSAAGQDHADYNRIYRNTFYHNGHQETDPGFQGGMYFANWSGQSPVGNIVKGNLFYDNKNGAVTYEGQVNPQVIEDNWDQNSVDPKFVNLSASDPSDPNLPDLRLQASSPCIDTGAYPTRITSAAGSGTQFQVVDARYFIDGWRIPHVQGDEIQLADGQRARIADVDYETNVITVDRALTWTQNQGIALAYEGSAPDLGAYEFVPELVLHGTPADRAIHLTWSVNTTLPPTSTWQIGYRSQTGTLYPAITGIISPTRAYTLTGLANYVWYTVTLNAMLDASPILTDTVRAIPTDRFVYLPLVMRSASSGGSQTEGCQVFPSDHIWNVPIDTLPVDANSAAYINTIGYNTGLHPDFGSGTWEGFPIGIPFVTVPGTQSTSIVTFQYDDESDPGPYPIPPNPPIEGDPDGDGDRHILVVDRDACVLYELFAAHLELDGWHAGSGAIFDLNSYDLRPDGWTSADAAGLPILPGLVRYDEVASGEIRHAIRFTAKQTNGDYYVWPARHKASSLSGAQYPPMGQRFRLRADFDMSGFSPEVQVILQAMKTYGIILADNGSNWFISGVPDERWDNDALHELGQVHGSDFEAVDVSSLMIDPDSGQAQS